jgi:hypothetical protein
MNNKFGVGAVVFYFLKQERDAIHCSEVVGISEIDSIYYYSLADCPEMVIIESDLYSTYQAVVTARDQS